MSARGYGSIVVSVLSGDIGLVVERYHPNFHPHYMDWRVRFPNQTYRIVRDRHLREPLSGEIRAFQKQFAAERPKP